MNRGRIPIGLCGLSLVLAPHLLFGDTVDNPGPFTINVTGGYVMVGTTEVDFDPSQGPAFLGTVDSDGNMLIPAFNFPDIIYSGLTIRVELQDDNPGSINPLTGDSSIQVPTFFVRLPVFGDNCGVGPFSGTLTTGDSGGLSGQPYDQTAGTVTYVNNDVALPRSTGCGIYGLFIDQQLGLPSPAGNNQIVIVGQFDPVLTGS